MIDRALNEVVVVRKRSRVWRIIQFAVVTLITVIALMNVFIWQYVVHGVGTAILILIGFLYLVTFLECFNQYHFNCPVCGMEYKTSDFEVAFTRRCDNCKHNFRITFVDTLY